MAFLTYADRVAETTTTTGTGTIQLAGAVDAKFRTFVAGVGTGATVPYVVVHRTANEWEVGYGVVTAGSPNTLTRAGIYSSSNSNNAVNFSAGTKDVFLSLPGSKTVRFDDATGGLAVDGTTLVVDAANDRVGIGTASPGFVLDVAGGVARLQQGMQILDTDGYFAFANKTAGATGNYGLYYSGSTASLQMWTANTERLRITSSGNVGIGTASPGAQLHVNADFIVNSTAKFGAEVACVANADNVTAPLVSWNKDTSGNNFFAGFVTEGGAGTLRGTIQYNRGTGQVVYNTTSDARLKENITPAEEAGARIDAMQVRQFDWKESGTHVHHGFVAQELYAVAPEAVSASDDESVMWAVDYSKLVPLMVKEIQSLRARLAALEGE
jgi:hypothetical protein